MSKQKLKYYIEFSEIIENPEDIHDEQLSRISREIEKHLSSYLILSDIKPEGNMKLEFDLEEVRQ